VVLRGALLLVEHTVYLRYFSHSSSNAMFNANLDCSCDFVSYRSL
jgi:hypothetical protein